MKTSMTHQEYQRLELISDSQSTDSQAASQQPANSRFNQASSPAATRLRQIWRSALTRLTTYFSASSELRVWTANNAAGQPVWKVYDPMTQTRNEFASELDLRVWLEARYYQTPDLGASYVSH